MTPEARLQHVNNPLATQFWEGMKKKQDMRKMHGRNVGRIIVWVMSLSVTLGALAVLGPGVSHAQEDESLRVMKGFTEQEKEESEIVKISTERKHQIMFIMGFILLVGVIATAALGVAMVLFGKEVFVAHMVCALFSVFLSIVHAVTAVVWFFPF